MPRATFINFRRKLEGGLAESDSNSSDENEEEKAAVPNKDRGEWNEQTASWNIVRDASSSLEHGKPVKTQEDAPNSGIFVPGDRSKA